MVFEQGDLCGSWDVRSSLERALVEVPASVGNLAMLTGANFPRRTLPKGAAWYFDPGTSSPSRQHHINPIESVQPPE